MKTWGVWVIAISGLFLLFAMLHLSFENMSSFSSSSIAPLGAIYWDVPTLTHLASESQSLQMTQKFEEIELLYASNAIAEIPAAVVQTLTKGRRHVVHRIRDIFFLTKNSVFQLNKLIVHQSAFSDRAHVAMIGTVVKSGGLINGHGNNCEFSFPAHIIQSINPDYTVRAELQYFDYAKLRKELEYCNDFSDSKEAAREVSRVLPEFSHSWQYDMGIFAMATLWKLVLSEKYSTDDVVSSRVKDSVRYFSSSIKKTGTRLTNKVPSYPSFVVNNQGDNRCGASGFFAVESKVEFTLTLRISAFDDILGAICQHGGGVRGSHGDVPRLRIGSQLSSQAAQRCNGFGCLEGRAE